ncbi:MAG: type II 3-dehydroquinate dehydratase [Rubrobacteraceae bacterium]
MSRIFVLNGVNLGALGTRRPEVYGPQTLRDIREDLKKEFPGVGLEFRQTDYEGEFLGWIREAASADGLVLNPGAWTHYSYALHDALETLEVPKVEVHISNIHRREDWRRNSVVSAVVDATVAGMGAYGYRVAVAYVLSKTEGE